MGKNKVIQSVILSCISRSLFLIFFLSIGSISNGQMLKAWHGSWSGTMFIYSKGIIRDSVGVVLTVAPINDSTLTWKTEYKSATQPMTKDYKMKILDQAKGIYGTDEGEGLVLTNYLVDNTLYALFETSGIVLTARYQLNGDIIDFEVTSSKRDTTNMGGVFNYMINNVQKVQLKRQASIAFDNKKGNYPLYFLNSEKISKSVMEKIDPATIESVNVFKGEEAIRRYGQEGTNGVILIKLKKSN